MAVDRNTKKAGEGPGPVLEPAGAGVGAGVRPPEGGVNPVPGGRGRDPDRQEGVDKLIAEVRKTGLCGNCAVFKTCRLEKRGKGVWYCDDYKATNG